MPTNSSRLNVVARLKSIRPARNNRTSSRYSGIGVRPVASPRTIVGLAASARAMSAANDRATAVAVVKTRMRNDAFLRFVARNLGAAARLGEREPHGPDRWLFVENLHLPS